MSNYLYTLNRFYIITVNVALLLQSLVERIQRRGGRTQSWGKLVDVEVMPRVIGSYKPLSVQPFALYANGGFLKEKNIREVKATAGLQSLRVLGWVVSARGTIVYCLRCSGNLC